MNEKDLNEILREFGLPLAIFLLVIAGCFFFIIPNVKQILVLRSELKKQSQEITALSAKVADLKTLSEAELYESANLLQEALPAEKDFYKVITLVKQLCQQNNVTLVTFSFSPGEIASESAKEKSALGLSSTSISLEFVSSFEDFLKLTNQVERILPLAEVSGIKFSLGTENGASASGNLLGFSGKMNLMTYYAPLPKVLGDLEKPLPKISNQDKKLIEDLKSYFKFQPEAEETPEVTVGRENPFPF